MAIVPQQQGLPFVMDPVSPGRVQLWAVCASQMSTRVGFNLISSVFSALWWHDAAYESYQALLEVRHLSVYDVSLQVFYLDGMVDALASVVDHWGRAIDSLRGLGIEGGQYYDDAFFWQSHLVTVLLPQAAHQIAFLCEQAHIPLPKQTQAFFARQQNAS